MGPSARSAATACLPPSLAVTWIISITSMGTKLVGLLGGIAVTDAHWRSARPRRSLCGRFPKSRMLNGKSQTADLVNALLSRGATHVLELMNRIVVRVCRVVPDLEDANRAIDDVAVLIELDVDCGPGATSSAGTI